MLTPRPRQHRQEPGNHLPKVPGVLHPSCALAGGQILAPRPSPPPPRQIGISRSEVQAPCYLYIKKMTWVPRVTQQVKSYHVCCFWGPVLGAPAQGQEGLVSGPASSRVSAWRFRGSGSLGRTIWAGSLPLPSLGCTRVSERPWRAGPQVRALAASSPSACSRFLKVWGRPEVHVYLSP